MRVTLCALVAHRYTYAPPRCSTSQYSRTFGVRGFCRVFVLPVLEYCSAVRCSCADTYLKLPDRVFRGYSFITGGVFECDLTHRRSAAVLCILHKIRCNPMHPHHGALPVPMGRCEVHAVLWSHIGTLMRLLAAEHRSTAGLLFTFQYLYGTILVSQYSMVWDWRVSRSGPMPFY